MKQNATLPFRRSAAAFLCCLICATTFAQEDAGKKPVPFDKEQQAIVDQVLDKMTADIKALKGKYPQLAHFGDAPWFTRGPGDFRYDYKITEGKSAEGKSEAKVQPGGCGIYFSLTPVNAPYSKWLTYYQFVTSGITRAGITLSFAITTEIPDNGLNDAARNVLFSDLDFFEKLAAEHELKHRNVKEDAGSLLDALGSTDKEVRRWAALALPGRKLTAKEIDRLKEGYLQGKFSWEWTGIVLKVLQEQDKEHLEDFCLEMAKATLATQEQGKDTFKQTPLANMPWMSNASAAREGMIRIFGSDEQFEPVAMLILNEDTDLRNRLEALDYLVKLPAEKRMAALAAALQNSYRSVQAKGADLAVTLHATGVDKELAALLASPSRKVRVAAGDAVEKLGIKGLEMNPKRTLPASVAHIADTLWQSGLREADVVAVCAHPETSPYDPLRWTEKDTTVPEQSSMPEGVKVREAVMRDQNGASVENVRHDYYIDLQDPWRMTTMDADSVKKRGAQFVVGIKKDWTTGVLDATGPFLVAAAMKLNDPATAQAVYERLCDGSETDDEILDIGLEGLGWERIQAALGKFQSGEDDAAQTQFNGVLELEKLSRPFTYLYSYVKLAHQVSADIERRKKEGVAPAPVFPSAEECEQYWRGKIPDKKERIAAMIAQLENVKGDLGGGAGSGWDSSRGTYSLAAALDAEGKDAVEPLLDCVQHDDRLTRVVEMNMDHMEEPVRWMSTVRDVALKALEKMYDKQFLNQTNYADFTRGDPAALEKIAEEVRKSGDTRKQ